jgi:alpha-ribazole phosphatase
MQHNFLFQVISVKTVKIHLIRHGLSEGSTDGKYIGQTDVMLTEEGKRQLKDMKERMLYPRAEVVISSPMNRCLETAKILYPDSNPLILDGLNEYDFGEFEGQTAEELKTDPAFTDWLKGGADTGAPFGETNGQFQKRVCTCFNELVAGLIKTGVGDAVIISHGGVIMTLLQCFAIPERPMHEWLMPSGCGYTLVVTPSIWSNTNKGEVLYEIPSPIDTENEDDNDTDWDAPFDPSEFVGFYSPEEADNK